ncbi:MotA/TolQ/ExbB proton channel family protein [Ectothiorhodospiraceae bacterium WFHF3C12]|nr:MotA/TolQ/ExbB proton channel family protein [Ectothiorhodospiraceae bacterium WFHF3C12]
MFDTGLIALIHEFVGWLLQPVIAALFVVVAAAVWESGMAVTERWFALRRMAAAGNVAAVERLARRRIERADLITRTGPMLGLMGTLIPLGPGLSALGQGNLEILATAVTVAFDTTVMGLLAGVVGFVLARLRRRWYDQVLDAIEATDEHGCTQMEEQSPTPTERVAATIRKVRS